MKSMVIKCSCGRVSNPIHLEIVEDTWIKGNFAYAQFSCPQCLKRLTIKTELKDD